MYDSSNDRGLEMRGGGRNSNDRRQQRAEQKHASNQRPRLLDWCSLSNQLQLGQSTKVAREKASRADPWTT